MGQPRIAAKEPDVLTLEAGTYYWCTCGRSRDQPFCDGAHEGTGFEPLDILQSVLMLMRQLDENRCEVENQYGRVVLWEGNVQALDIMSEVFELRPYFEWRGLGFIAQSALKLSEAYADLDAELRFSVPGVRVADPKACQYGEVLKGVLKPPECKVFGTACTPERPLGALMVSSEGACAAYYNFGRKSFEKVEIGSKS